MVVKPVRSWPILCFYILCNDDKFKFSCYISFQFSCGSVTETAQETQIYDTDTKNKMEQKRYK
jgi:hypothetical protein